MSDYKSILVHYDGGRTAAARLEVAIQVAALFDAHVSVLYALDARPAPSAAHEAGQVLAEAQQRVQAQMLKEARDSYESCVRRTGYAKAQWRETTANALRVVPLHARYADLVVIGQKNPAWASGVGTDFEQRILLAAGKPVLAVPFAYERKPVGRRIMVAWNESREAARAVHDAMPLLTRADSVQVAVFQPASPGGHGEEPGADIATYLARHGVKVAVSHQGAQGDDVGNLLLSRAFDLQADLIVMGAWGHSRLAELVLGGVTRTLLESMTVPVLMSH